MTSRSKNTFKKSVKLIDGGPFQVNQFSIIHVYMWGDQGKREGQKKEGRRSEGKNWLKEKLG